MKYFGDIPKEHLELVGNLETLEKYLHDHKKELTSLNYAKGLVCLACDYYSIYFDEEGERLLVLTEKSHPGYFRDPLLDHAKEDFDYSYLISLMMSTPAVDVMRSFGFGQ